MLRDRLSSLRGWEGCRGRSQAPVIRENSPSIMGSSNRLIATLLRCHKGTSAASCKLSINIHWLQALTPNQKAIHMVGTQLQAKTLGRCWVGDACSLGSVFLFSGFQVRHRTWRVGVAMGGGGRVCLWSLPDVLKYTCSLVRGGVCRCEWCLWLER